MTKCTCLKCNYTWFKRVSGRPKACPDCKRRDWDKMKTTPNSITELAPNEIFVFGSNTAGRHGAGAARQARISFGAEYGVGEGLTGNSYAFPTLDDHLKQRTTEELQGSAETLKRCAKANPELNFFVTKVGCGLAGFTEAEIMPLFQQMPENVILPEGWNK